MVKAKEGRGSRSLRLILLAALSFLALLAWVGGFFALRGGAPFGLIIAAPMILPVLIWGCGPALIDLARVPRRKLIVGIFLAAAALRIVLILGVPNRPVTDFGIYHELAQSLLGGEGYAITGPEGAAGDGLFLGPSLRLPHSTAFRPPGTALWGALLGASPALFRLANALLGAGTSVLILLLVWPVDAAAAALAALLWAVYPASLFAANLYGSETLHAFFLVLLAWFAARLPAGRAKPGAMAAVGLGAGWCVLIHPPWAPLMAALGAVWLRTKPRAEALRRCLWAALFTAAAVAPWTARNWLLFRRFVPVSTNEGVLMGVVTGFHAPESAHGGPEWQTLQSEWLAADEPERAAVGRRIGLFHLRKTLEAGPSFALAAAADGLRSAFDQDSDMILLSCMTEFDLRGNEEPRIEYSLSPQARNLWLLAAHSFYVGMLLLAVLGLCFAESRGLLALEGVAFLSVYFLLMSGLFALFKGVNRYHFSLMIPVAIWAGAGARSIVSRRARIRLK